MDSTFRRIFFNLFTEVAPTASLEYVSSYALDISLGESVTLIASGRDLDRIGPNQVHFGWFNGDGTPFCKIDEVTDDGEVIWECEQEEELRAGTDLPRGLNRVKLKVMDNEGVWSEEVSVDIFVAEHLHQVHLPAIQVGY
jgi:hypothetical protein